MRWLIALVGLLAPVATFAQINTCLDDYCGGSRALDGLFGFLMLALFALWFISKPKSAFLSTSCFLLTFGTPLVVAVFGAWVFKEMFGQGFIALLGFFGGGYLGYKIVEMADWFSSLLPQESHKTNEGSGTAGSVPPQEPVNSPKAEWPDVPKSSAIKETSSSYNFLIPNLGAFGSVVVQIEYFENVDNCADFSGLYRVSHVYDYNTEKTLNATMHSKSTRVQAAILKHYLTVHKVEQGRMFKDGYTRFTTIMNADDMLNNLYEFCSTIAEKNELIRLQKRLDDGNRFVASLLERSTQPERQ